ncbi:MAG TPA: CHAT domain-containing tetratricopeptide repeat protein [Anaerolineae bacterium]|nr:CHAT domain-containing tetratricopeptide repeat protein [Anaerolineae bacterium]
MRCPNWIVKSLLTAIIIFTMFPAPVFATPATQGEDPKAEADTLFAQGTELLNSFQYRTALEKFEEALPLYRKAHDRRGEGRCLGYIGFVKYYLGDYAGALEAYEAALPIAQSIGDRSGEATILYTIGEIHRSLGQYPQALGYLQQALAIVQDRGDRSGERATFNNLGAVYADLGQYEQALDYLRQALEVQQELGDRTEEARTFNNIGLVYKELGQYHLALDYLRRALVIVQEVGDRVVETTTLNNVGLVYAGLGQYHQALGYFQQSLMISQQIGDRGGEARIFNNIGSVYHELGQYHQALDYFQQALPMLQGIGDQAGTIDVFMNLGASHSHLEQYQQALDYLQQALAAAEGIGYQAGTVTILNNIGVVYTENAQYKQALLYFQRALTISEQIGQLEQEGIMWNNIGTVFYFWGQYDQALDYYEQALAIFQEIGEPANEMIALGSIGSVYEQQGDNTRAISDYRQAIEVMESLRGEIKVEELKVSFAAGQVPVYEHLIGLLWDEGQFHVAFNYAERARARAFLDQLAGSGVDFRAGVAADLLERERTLRAEIGGLRQQLLTLRNRPQSEWDSDAIAAARTELTARESEYAQLLTEIKLQSPEVASLVSVDVASLADVQNLLDGDTTLVEYFVTEDRTLAFIITRNSSETVAIDVSRDDLTQAITTFRDFASLDEPQPVSLSQLYTWLIAPLKDKLKTPLVGIIPHGVLHYLPFAALTDGERYLSDDYALFTLPSASALRFIHEKRKPNADTLLALGNPTISETLPALHYAEQEVKTIADLYKIQPLVGNAASESAMKSQVGSASILHVAAHGEYNPSNPLFSVLYLAGDADDDGRLEVHEIYGLDLTKATDLVVLSACKTDVGAVSAGDEVVGLNRAFLYAGTPTVIASLWNVDDEATTFLMGRFYTHLRQGMGKAEALQAAQTEVRNNLKWAHPYYWAAFVLTGDAGKMTGITPGKLAEPVSVNTGLLIILVMALGLLLWVGFRTSRHPHAHSG